MLQDKWLCSTRLFKHELLFSDKLCLTYQNKWFYQLYYTIFMMMVMLTMKGLGGKHSGCVLAPGSWSRRFKLREVRLVSSGLNT